MDLKTDEYIHFCDICPSCGSTRRDAQEQVDKQVAAGKMKDDVLGISGYDQTPLYDPRITLFNIDVLVHGYDYCSECHTCYSVMSKLINMPLSGVNTVPSGIIDPTKG